MAVVASVGSNPPSGLAALPTPVKLALAGGGIGLVVFLMRKRSQPTDVQTQLLPNTAIMLGSLQQSILETKGLVGTSAADLSNQVAGSQESISAQLAALTSETQKGLTTLQGNLIANQNTNSQTIMDSLKVRGDALAKLIGDNALAQQAANQAFSQSISEGLGAIIAQQNAESAAVATLGSNLTTTQQQLAGQLQQLSGQVQGLAAPAAKADWNWNFLNGKKIFSTTDQNWYTVQNGNVLGVSFWDTVPGKQFGDQMQQINIPYSLKQYSTGMFSSGG